MAWWGAGKECEISGKESQSLLGNVQLWSWRKDPFKLILLHNSNNTCGRKCTSGGDTTSCVFSRTPEHCGRPTHRAQVPSCTLIFYSLIQRQLSCDGELHLLFQTYPLPRTETTCFNQCQDHRRQEKVQYAFLEDKNTVISSSLNNGASAWVPVSKATATQTRGL